MDQMKNPLMLASGALAAASVGTGADAQSIPDGFYAGLSLGDYVGANNDDGYSWDGSSRGGVFVGYDRDFGNFFVGGEVALTLGGDLTVYGADPYTGSNLVDYKIRFGKEFGSTKLYGFAGYSTLDAVDDTGDLSLSGMNGGLGMSHAIKSNIDIGLEYTRRDLDDSAAYYTATDNLSTVALRLSFQF